MVLKKVTAKEWKDMGLPSEINTIHFNNDQLVQKLKERQRGEELLKKLKSFLETSWKLSEEYNIKNNIKSKNKIKKQEYRIDPVTGKQVPK